MSSTNILDEYERRLSLPPAETGEKLARLLGLATFATLNGPSIIARCRAAETRLALLEELLTQLRDAREEHGDDMQALGLRAALFRLDAEQKKASEQR